MRLSLESSSSSRLLLFTTYNPFSFVFLFQSASISWDYKKSEESAKVEIWDVVDRGMGEALGAPGKQWQL